MKARRRPFERKAFILMEEAVALVRTAPLQTLAYYYVGSLPFVLGIFYFWADMAMHADAYQRAAPMALLMAVLFLWMKCWHVVYARALDAHLRDTSSPHWDRRRLGRMVVNQTILQTTGLVLLPLSLMLILPFGWLYALYQNLTVLDDGLENNHRELTRRAWHYAKFAPKQNLFSIWLLSPMLMVTVLTVLLVLLPVFQQPLPVWAQGLWGSLLLIVLSLMTVVLNPLGFILALNFSAVLVLTPELLRMLMGVETLASRLGFIADPALIIAAGCLTFLALDPLMKAVYVLRIFYASSRRTGEDLRAALRRIRVAGTAVILVGALLLIGAMAPKAAAAIDPDDLDTSIEQVLQQREFKWRAPRVEARQFEGDGIVMRSLRWMSETIESWIQRFQAWLDRIRDWLRSRSDGEWTSRSRSGPVTLDTIQTVGYVLMAGMLAIGAILAWRTWRQRREKPDRAIEETEAAPPDIEDEETAADALPEDGWIAMAHELMAKGESRLALRALFLASLAWLHQQGLVAVDRGKSNRDYLRELTRRAHGGSGLLPPFQSQVITFEQVWYGRYDASDALLRDFMDRQDQMRRGLQAVEAGQRPPSSLRSEEPVS